MSNDALVLGGEFPTPERSDWMALVDKVLGDASYEKVLVSTTYDGLRIEPLYTGDDIDVAVDPGGLPGSDPQTRGAYASGHVDGGWDVRQRVLGPTASTLNRAILDELERGATSVLLDLGSGQESELAAILKGVHLDLAAVCFTPGDTRAASTALTELWEARSVVPGARLASLGLDPIGDAARRGTDPTEWIGEIVGLANAATPQPGVRPIAVDATPYADAGASEAVELACSMATAVEYLRVLTGAGTSVDDAAGRIEFTYAASADQFLTIAKLRAARRLWARVVEASGGAAEARAQRQHVVTSSAMMTRRDPWVNMLRTTIAGFAAGVGGADAVTVAPFDSAIGVSDDFARRIARNTQLLLIEESHLGRVIDPAGGSWYVEDLTERLALEAWTRFQEIEGAGGMIASIADGSLAATIDGQWEARLANLARRKDPITGVTEFPNLDEAAVDRPPVPAAPVGLFPLRRHSAPFEALRDAADDAAATIFLANLGSIATHTARAGFATNLFEVGGIAALANDGFVDASAAAAGFVASGSRLAVICSSDATYADLADDTARALKQAGAERVYLAGHPGDRRDVYESAGIDEFIHMGCDVLAILQRAHRTLGLDPVEVTS